MWYNSDDWQLKALLHMQFLMRFRVQNAPYATLKECFFSRSIAWIGNKVITYYLKTPLFPISANLAVFCRSVARLKTRAGQAGAGFVRKIVSKIARINGPLYRYVVAHSVSRVFPYLCGNTLVQGGRLLIRVPPRTCPPWKTTWSLPQPRQCWYPAAQEEHNQLVMMRNVSRKKEGMWKGCNISYRGTDKPNALAATLRNDEVCTWPWDGRTEGGADG